MRQTLTVFLSFLCATLVFPATTVQAQTAPRNVILMIPDGFGPASLALGREFKGEAMNLDGIIVGLVQTAATDSRVTDSAASGTAYATGVRTYNGAIAVDTLQQPLATVLEAVERKGLATGLVATSRITHATPACFASHVPNRGMETEIAAQMMEQNIEVIFGGGRAFFLPGDMQGRRDDGRNLLTEAADGGYQVIENRDQFLSVTTTPVLGLFTPSHMSYDIDRDPAVEPGLAEMTRKAIDLLDDDPDGFFLMVEGSRIDHAAHANDGPAHVRDILAYDEAVGVALDFARTDGETLVISVADHETGGMTLGRRIETQSVYGWNPDALARATNSLEGIGQALVGGEALMEVLEHRAGLTEMSDEEKANFQQLYDARSQQGLGQAIVDAMSERAVIGWTTNGHTGVDVNLGAFGPGADRLHGSHINAEIGRTIADLLNLDLTTITKELQNPTD